MQAQGYRRPQTPHARSSSRSETESSSFSERSNSSTSTVYISLSVTMAGALCMTSLVVLTLTISIVTSILPVDKQVAMGTTLKVQENLGSYQELGQFQDKVNEDSVSIISEKDKPKAKKQCWTEVKRYGYSDASNECKKMLSSERMLCQIMAENKAVALSEWCEYLVSQDTCTEDRDCKYAGTACCWLPGKTSKNRCVKKANTHHVSLHNEDDRKIPRKTTLYFINFYIKIRDEKSLTVMVLPVGQGDCIVMYCPNGYLVVFDCGSRDKKGALTSEDVQNVIWEKVQRVTVFISHADADHYNYLPTIFKDTAKVDRVIIGGNPQHYDESDRIRKWMQNVAGQEKLYAINEYQKCIGDCNSKIHKVRIQNEQWNIERSEMTELSDMNICGDGAVNFDIIAANVGRTKNQKSIVLKVTTGTRSMLLSGDMEGSAAKTIARTENVKTRLQSNVFQISHHGASTLANKIEWLRAVRPEEAFVSHVYNGQYGHPRCDAITQLINIGSIRTNVNPFKFTHPFTCIIREGQRNVPYSGEICHYIYSTYPKENTICVIRFKMGRESAYTIQDCYKL